MNRKQMISVAVIAVALAASAYLTFGRRQSSLGDRVWYYDLGSGDLFPAPRGAVPPISTPSGAANGVVAGVFACGECSDQARQVLYLITQSPQAVDAAKQMEAGAADKKALAAAISAGRLIAPVPAKGQEPAWIAADSPQGRQLSDTAYKLCGSQPTATCMPR